MTTPFRGTPLTTVPTTWLRLGALVGLAALTFATGCRKTKTASVEDLYATRTLGLGYLQRNQLPEAEAEFKKLTTMAPDDALGYADLGIVYLRRTPQTRRLQTQPRCRTRPTFSLRSRPRTPRT